MAFISLRMDIFGGQYRPFDIRFLYIVFSMLGDFRPLAMPLSVWFERRMQTPFWNLSPIAEPRLTAPFRGWQHPIVGLNDAARSGENGGSP